MGSWRYSARRSPTRTTLSAPAMPRSGCRNAQVDVAAVRAYRAAIAQKTRSGLTASDIDDLDKPMIEADERNGTLDHERDRIGVGTNAVARGSGSCVGCAQA